MSTVKSKNLQVGTDATATNNFTIYQPSTPDGTLRIGVGNADSPTEVGRFNSNGYVATNAPAFSAYLSASQSVTTSTYTKVNIDTEIFDTDSCFDTSTYRFTPTVAGYYQVNGIIRSLTSNQTQFIITIYKNGSEFTVGVQNRDTTSLSNQYSVSDLIYMNGTTDYLELYGYLVGTSPTFNVFSITSTSKFSGYLARAA